MGLINTKKKKLLSAQEIQQISSSHSSLQIIYNQNKNANGFLEIKDMVNIFDNKIDIKLVKKLYQLCSSEKNKFTIDDFKYLYSLFITTNYEAKLNFITELIFKDKSQITLEKYKKKVEFLFGLAKNIYSKLSSEEYIKNMTHNSKITKENFVKNLEGHYKNFIQNFSFFGQTENEEIMNDKLILSTNHVNNFVCECNKGKLKKAKSECFKNTEKYDKMESEFRRIEKNNNGVFAISNLENLLKEVDINPKIISLIISYLKKKTQKSFIDFQNFKILISRFSESQEEIAQLTYEMIAFPKDYIFKSDLFLLVKSIRPNLNSKEINNIFEKLEIKNEKVFLNKFEEIFKLISDDIYESLEKIQYIPHIFFKIKCEDKVTEKNCIEILMKNNKDLKSYIEDIIRTEKEFYLVDLEFWVNWCNYTHWTSLDKNNERKRIDEKNITIKEVKPKINTSQIADSNGRLFQGLIYFRDYVMVTEKMYELFSYWYILLGPVIKREKIVYLSEEEGEEEMTSNKQHALVYEREMKCEIEVYPIFLKFYMFDDIVNKASRQTLEGILEQLSNLANLASDKPNNIRLYPFSRTTKFRELLKNVESSRKLESGKNRLWMFYQNKFYSLTQSIDAGNRSLQDDNINDLAIVICEVMKDKSWPSENLENEKVAKTKISLNSKVFVGLMNIGNTCYMNSVLQLFLNNHELKNILLTEFFENSINYRNKNGAKGTAMTEFINMLKEKWMEDKKLLIAPKKWKEIIGELNQEFKGFDQQDAHDYFNFMLDLLHEETNLKIDKEYIENPEKYDGSEEELASEYWANNLRRNASFVHSLYLGQLKSSLICQRCNYTKISYETFSSISVPIPQESKLVLEIILFRLPFTFKVYYENFEQFFANLSANFENFDVRAQLKLIRKQSLDYNIDLNNVDESIISEKSLLHDSNTKYIGKLQLPDNENTHPVASYEVLNTNTCEVNNKIREGEQFHTSTLITNIPIRIKIEVDKKEKVEKIITLLKRIYDLELEREENKFTQFLIYNQGTFVDKNLKIDDCFQNNQTLYIYELLNTNGINKLFNYVKTDANEASVLPLSQDTITAFNINKNLPNDSTYEFLVKIIHRHPTTKEDVSFFNNYTYEKLETFPHFMIINNKKSVKVSHLYDFIWEKYEYFVTNPTKLEKSLWWKPQIYKKKIENHSEMSQSVKFCTPFVIKILNKESLSCKSCPWFRFCSGCTIDPLRKEYLEINSTHVIVVEWCSEVVKKDISKVNLKLVIDHPSVKQADEGNNVKNPDTRLSIEDCLNLFTEKEDLGDDQFFCIKCRQQTSWFKQYQIERLPPYLVLVLKRFKFTRMYKRKIDSFIDFPVNELDLSKYMCNGEKNNSYNKYSNTSVLNLFGVVNHSGSLNGGHYTAMIRHDNKWVKYDDSNAYEAEENSVKSSAAYILVYKTTDENLIKNSNYLNLMKEVVFNENDLSGVLKLGERRSSILKSSVLSKGMIDLAIYDKETTPNKEFPNVPSCMLNQQSSFDYLKKSLVNSVKFFNGEPVKTAYGRGFVLYCYEYENVPFVKVKLKMGYAFIRVCSNENIKKESIFKFNKPTKEEEEKEKEEVKLKSQKNNKKEGDKKKSGFTARFCKCLFIK